MMTAALVAERCVLVDDVAWIADLTEGLEFASLLCSTKVA